MIPVAVSRNSEAWSNALAHVIDRLPKSLGCVTARACSCASEGSGLRLLGHTGRDVPEPLISDVERERAVRERTPRVVDELGSSEVVCWLLLPLEPTADGNGEEIHVWLGLSRPSHEISLDAICSIRDQVREDVTHSGCRASRRVPEFAAAALEVVPLPIVVVDPRGHVLLETANFSLLMGHAPDHGNAHLDDVVIEPWRAIFEQALESTIEREATVEVPLPPLQAPYDPFDFRLSTGLIEAHHGGPAVVFVVRDVAVGSALSRTRTADSTR